MTPEALLGLFLAEARGQSAWAWSSDAGERLATTQLILAEAPVVRGRVALLAAEALAVPPEGGRYDSAWSPALGFLVELVVRDAALDADALTRLVGFSARWPAWDWLDTPPYDVVLDAVSGALAGRAPAPPLARALRDLRVRLAVEGAWDEAGQARLQRMETLLRPPVQRADALLDPSDPWGLAVEAAIRELGEKREIAWRRLLTHAATARRSAPSDRWLREARRRLDAVGPAELLWALGVWLPEVPVGLTRSQAEERQALRVTYGSGDDEGLPIALSDDNRVVVRGLLWTAGLVDAVAMVEVLQATAERCYAPIPGVGVGDGLIGNAAVRGLALTEAGRARRDTLLEAVVAPRARRFIARVLG